ncbi:hypothetical protein [Desulfatitalea alkaliphila]|uniref:Response regulatory domain-containing protein n=1 Tax=Desulfatitalea alkaliphila TaxID=2929485 RepID=A0AA41UKC4_9BACT|nr:hypothetical protein [Desulfatitalea alkaliphila]MCJ8502905.1 hypothetical protein [Desulfatitalea alkaliphila]
MRIVLVTSRQADLFRPFREALAETPEDRVEVLHSAIDALDAVRHDLPHLVIVDDPVGEMSALSVVRQLLEFNAFVNTAVLSNMDEEAFHEQSEGLGVLCRLPSVPGLEDAKTVRRLLGGVVAD